MGLRLRAEMETMWILHTNPSRLQGLGERNRRLGLRSHSAVGLSQALAQLCIQPTEEQPWRRGLRVYQDLLQGNPCEPHGQQRTEAQRQPESIQP